MIFAHGFGCDQNMWRYIVPAFSQQYRVVLFDYVGAGKSDAAAYHSSRYSSLNGYADDLLEICADLGIEHAIFVGHSVSCMIGVLASIRQPRLFEKMILIGPSARYINDDPYVGGFEKADIDDLLETMDKNYIGWANFLAPAIVKNPDRPELANELMESFCSTDPRIAREFAQVTFFSDNRHDLEKVTVPSLLLQCSEDLIAPFEVGHYLAAQLPKSTLKIMAATGHCPHLSHPAETIRSIRDYLHTESFH